MLILRRFSILIFLNSGLLLFLRICQSGATGNRTCYLSGCISLNLHSAKDLISRYCSTDFLQCFASFSWVIFLSMCKGNRIHGKEQLFSVLFLENNSFGVLPSFCA